MTATPGPRTLGEALESAIRGLGGVERQVGPDGAIELARGGRPFAVVDPAGLAASFRLAPAVAAAALRTPDTAPSRLGRGWVTLRPVLLDARAVDRATAWLESAWRQAAD